MPLLRAGAFNLEVDPELLRLATPRSQLQHFLTSDGAPHLTVRRVSSFSPGFTEQPLEGVMAPWGFFAAKGDELEGRIPDDAYAAEAVLRAAYQIAVARQGGLLIHASGVAFGESALVATGVSGAGKSTLARLCVEGGARLLSDEIMALYPDGHCHGTPFRSDLDLAGTPAPAQLRSVLLLHKAQEEQLVPWPTKDALPVVLSQTYRGVTAELSGAQALVRVGAVLDRVGVRRLSFRKHPDVGPFLRRWLRENGGA